MVVEIELGGTGPNVGFCPGFGGRIVSWQRLLADTHFSTEAEMCRHRFQKLIRSVTLLPLVYEEPCKLAAAKLSKKNLSLELAVDYLKRNHSLKMLVPELEPSTLKAVPQTQRYSLA